MGEDTIVRKRMRASRGTSLAQGASWIDPTIPGAAPSDLAPGSMVTPPAQDKRLLSLSLPRKQGMKLRKSPGRGKAQGATKVRPACAQSCWIWACVMPAVA
jgi:hypothetical protein